MEFQSFDSLEAMFDAIDKARQAADARVQPWQAEIKQGDYFIQATQYGFFIFGEVLEQDDYFYKTEQGRNYRLCRCWSVACPMGEVGDVHCSQVAAVISARLFEKFKENNWVVDFLQKDLLSGVNS